MSDRCRYVVEDGRLYVHALHEGEPHAGSARWALCDVGSNMHRAAVLADGGVVNAELAYADRLRLALEANAAFLRGRKELPDVVPPQPPGEEAKRILRRAADGRIPLGVALDYLEDLRREGKI